VGPNKTSFTLLCSVHCRSYSLSQLPLGGLTPVLGLRA